MDQAQFWAIIDATRKRSGGDQDVMREALRESLGVLPTSEIVAFDRITEELVRRAYRWDLWGAAFIMNGGCSDDAFEYFRRWLVAMGREVYENALSDPDSLAAVTPTLLLEDEYFDFESLISPAWDLHEERTGEDMMVDHDLPSESDPAGTPWEEDDLPRLFPRLAKRRGA